MAKQSIAALFGLYRNLFATLMRSVALCVTAFFRSAYLCEEAFSQVKIIKSRYRSRPTDEHVNSAFTCCLSNCEASFHALSQDVQCRAQTSQQEA
jgi:hypothetical protein